MAVAPLENLTWVSDDGTSDFPNWARGSKLSEQWMFLHPQHEPVLLNGALFSPDLPLRPTDKGKMASLMVATAPALIEGKIVKGTMTFLILLPSSERDLLDQLEKVTVFLRFSFPFQYIHVFTFSHLGAVKIGFLNSNYSAAS